MELAHRPGHPARLAAHHHKVAVEDWLPSEFENFSDAETRLLAKQVMLLIEGCISMILIHGDTSYVTAAIKTAKKLTLKTNK